MTKIVPARAALALLLGAGCFGKTAEDPLELVPLVVGADPVEGEIAIDSWLDASASFKHMLTPTLREPPAGMTFRRGALGPCTILDTVGEIDYVNIRWPRLRIGAVGVTLPEGDEALYAPAHVGAVAQDHRRWDRGTLLRVSASGDELPALEETILQASPVFLVEPLPSSEAREVPRYYASETIKARIVEMSGGADLRVHWSGEVDGDTVRVWLGGNAALVSDERTPGAGVHSRWARCDGRGGELTIPSRVVATIRAAVPELSWFGIQSFREALVLGGEVPTRIVTTMAPSSGGGPIRVVYRD